MNSLARITTKTSASVIDVNPDAVIDFILLQQQQQQRPIAEAPAAAAATSRHGILRNVAAGSTANTAAAAAPPASSCKSVSSSEKSLSELRREIRTMGKSLDHHSVQILNISRFQQKLRAEEALAKLNQELFEVREALDAQSSLSKRQRAEMEAMAHEMSALKKLNQNQRNELKQISTVAVGDLQTLKRECREGLELLTSERERNEARQEEVSSIADALRTAGEEQKAEVTAVKGELKDTRESYRVQMVSVKTCLEAIMKEVGETKRTLAETHEEVRANEARAATTKRALGGAVNRAEEQSNNQRAILGKTRAGLEELQKCLDERLRGVGEDLESIRAEQEKVAKSGDAVVARFEARVASVEGAVGGAESRIAEAAKEISERCDGGLARLREQAEKERRDFEDHVQCQLEAGRRNLAESLSRIQAEFLNSKRQSAADQDNFFNYLEDRRKGEEGKMRKLASSVGERMNELDGMYDDMQDRVFEIDRNRKNNLVFYGVRADSGDSEDQDDCELKIKHVMNMQLKVTREIPLTRVERLWNGPSLRGVKPVLVCFQLFKDKEELLRKSNMLLKASGPNCVYVTEDFSRRVRKHREALLAYARELRDRDASVRCLLQYDRLYAGNEVFLFNEVEQKVERVLMRPGGGGGGTAEVPGSSATPPSASSSAPSASLPRNRGSRKKKQQKQISLPTSFFTANGGNGGNRKGSTRQQQRPTGKRHDAVPSGCGSRCPDPPPSPRQQDIHDACDDGSSCSGGGGMRRNLGDGLSSDNEDGDGDDDDATVEDDLSVQIEVFGSPELDDEAAAALLPAPFSRTAKNTLEVVVEEDLAVLSPSPNVLPPIKDICNARYATECKKKCG